MEKKRVLMPLADGFDEIEAFTLAGIMKRAGLDVKQVGLQGVILTGSDGTKVVAEGKFDDVDPTAFDGIVLVGGTCCERFGKCGTLINAVKEFDKQGKCIAAIGEAPCILSEAGILRERRATVKHGMERNLSRPRDERIVIDENIITARGPSASLECGLKVIEKMISPERVNFAKEVLEGKEDSI